MPTTIEQPDPRTLGGLSPLRWAVRVSQRPWWEAHYLGGKHLGEWDTPPGVATNPLPDATRWRESRWEEVSKRGMIGLRLLCPDGRYGELRTDNPEGRFVQFKRGEVVVGVGGAPSFRRSEAHVIGVVADDGTGFFWAWEVRPHAYVVGADTGRCISCGLDPSRCGGRLVSYKFTERLIESVPDPAWPERKERSRVTDVELVGAAAFGHLVAFRDDVRAMKYRHIGALAEQVQGIRL